MTNDIWVASGDVEDFEQWCDEYGFEHAVTGWLRDPYTEIELSKYIVAHEQGHRIVWLKQVWC